MLFRHMRAARVIVLVWEEVIYTTVSILMP